MATNYTSIKFAYNVSRSFIESVQAGTGVPNYVFLSNSLPYEDEEVLPDLFDTEQQEKDIWLNMFAAKKITANEVEMVLPRQKWVTGNVYKQYDDAADLETLLTESDNKKRMYVMNSSLNVYKCLSNNYDSVSTVQPFGDYTTANGFIQTSDGYLWKYMYSINLANRYLTPNWMPVPYSFQSSKYDLSELNLVDGVITNIVVIDSGTDYVDSEKISAPFLADTRTLFLDSSDNVVVGMAVSGNGISAGTYITDINPAANTITISYNTVSPAGGDSDSNRITISTRVVVEGDGNNDILVAPILLSGGVERIEVSSFGTGYSKANVLIFGTGSGASARVVFGPKYGHGINSAAELGAKNVMIAQKIGEIDATESGKIDTDISFRQYGILSEPSNYGSVFPPTSSEAIIVASQTYNVTVVAGDNYIIGETVYQGPSLNNAFFSGVIHNQDLNTNTIKLISVTGTFTPGAFLTGTTSSVSKTAVSIQNPDLEPFSGNILAARNITKVDRALGQAEFLKIVLNFKD